MTCRTQPFLLFVAKVLLIGALMALTRGTFAQTRWESIGLRFGFYPDGAARDFYRADVCSTVTLPWVWHVDSVWTLQTGLDASMGLIGEHAREAAVFSAGPTLTLSRNKVPVSLEVGVSPTVLTRTDFASKDFGFPLQFASYAGLNFEVGAHIRFTYRFQHMSNAAIAHPNPGLNLHVLGVSYLF